MNSKIAMSALSIMGSLAIMGGATFAFFSSSATSTGNVFASGNLELLIDDNNESTPSATITASIGDTDMAPGDFVSGFVSLHNDGSITIAEVNIDSVQTVTSSPDLATQMNIQSATIGDDQACTVNQVVATGSFPSTLAGLDADPDGVDLPGTSLAPAQTKYLCMTFQFNSTADNTYQGKSITETFTFVGHQDLTQ